MKKYKIQCVAAIWVAAFLPVLAAVPVRANTDVLIEGAKTCTQYFPTQEQHYRIPLHLLAAIASAESGRWHQGLNMPLPWPWTINAAGKSYYLPSKAEAIAKARTLQAKGVKSMDVGCMQVNLKHHANAFRDLNEAFDPKRNVAYAAEFLRNNYDELGDWVKATAAYHSRTPKLGGSYLKRIEVTWNRIVERVRAAYERRGTLSAYAQPENPLKHAGKFAGVASAPRGGEVAYGLASTRGVKVLSVSDDGAEDAAIATISAKTKTGPHDAVLVVTPNKNSITNNRAPVQVAYAREPLSDAFLTFAQTEKPQAEVKAKPLAAKEKSQTLPGLDKAKETSQKRKQPNFVFGY